MLLRTVDEQGIDTSNLVMDKSVPTTLAFVHIASDGERSFSFYRNHGADMMLKKEDVNVSILQSTRIFHFGSLSMTHEEIESVTKMAVEIAKKGYALISFDPNLRPPLWDRNPAKVNFAYQKKQYEVSVGKNSAVIL